MGLPADRSLKRVLRRLPVGAKYVVEGFGGDQGDLRVVARYLLLPDGHRLNVPSDLSRPQSSRVLALRRGSPAHAPAKGRSRSVKKFAARAEPHSGADVN